jgi:hypothetical protein
MDDDGDDDKYVSAQRTAHALYGVIGTGKTDGSQNRFILSQLQDA